MPATELDRIQQQNDERWQAALTTFQELSAQYHVVVKTVQSGFNTLSHDSAALHKRLAQIEAKLVTMDTTFNQLLPHMAAIAAYVVAQREREQQRLSPQPRPRQSRRPNGE